MGEKSGSFRRERVFKREIHPCIISIRMYVRELELNLMKKEAGIEADK